jgi:autotransporter-associated beta strand protein
MRMKTKPMAAVVAAVLSAFAVQAATFTWKPAPAQHAGLWDRSQNWDSPAGESIPQDSLTHVAVFDAEGSQSVNVNTDAAAASSITFTVNAQAYTFGGANTLNIGSGGVVNNSANIQTITSAIQLDASQTWNSGAGLTLIGNTLDLGAHTLTVGGTGNAQIWHTITGAGGLSKSGAGILSLAGPTPNTFSGALTINEGTLVAGKSGAIPNVPITVHAGARLEMGNEAASGRVSSFAPIALIDATLATSGYTENFGALTANVLPGDVSSLDLTGTTFGDVAFASLTIAGGSTLNILGWTGTPGQPGDANVTSRIFVNTTVGSEHLERINFIGSGVDGAMQLGSGELTPVPEPHEYALLFAFGLLGFALLRRYKMARAV